MQGDTFQQGTYLRQLMRCLQMGYSEGKTLLGSVYWREETRVNLFARFLTSPEFYHSMFAFQRLNSTLLGCITQPLIAAAQEADLKPAAWSSSESRSSVRHKCSHAFCWSTSSSLTLRVTQSQRA